ncbi:hypothetical protein NDU88_001437 [Pleurodeles waltl]|uniref:Uncharacterized protein n=1 Tax=Pleurodeles waltl TaxID=8319 RepID=A0AAV7RBM5_PLEWA|nr:hypothetical protein NDU88_001437 [Pleurodeles waltl]
MQARRPGQSPVGEDFSSNLDLSQPCSCVSVATPVKPSHYLLGICAVYPGVCPLLVSTSVPSVISSRGHPLKQLVSLDSWERVVHQLGEKIIQKSAEFQGVKNISGSAILGYPHPGRLKETKF